MPTTRRSRTVPVAAAELWETVGDPHHLPRWWPRVTRVEQVAAGSFTQVMQTKKGRTVRADFRLTELRAPSEIAWAQMIEGTPFERVLTAATYAARMTPADGDRGTRIELEARQSLRGFARFGGLMVRRAGRRSLDEALDALVALHAA